MKKLISLLLVTTLVLAGCGGNNNNNDTSNSSNNTTTNTTTDSNTTTTAPAGNSGGGAEENLVLNIAIFEGGYGRDFWDEVVGLFEAETGYTVNMQISPNIGDIIRPEIVAGNPPDFLNLNDNDQTGIVAALIKDRGLLDLTDVFNGPQFDTDAALKNKIIDGFLDSYKCSPYGDGKIFLAPGNVSPMGLIYNKNLFAEKGWSVPVTWDDFFDLGDKAKAEGMSLFTYQGIYPGYIESVLFPALASHLGNDYSQIEDFTPGIWSDSRSLAVLENFAKIYSGGYLMPGTVALNHTDSQAAQMMNEALFIPNGTWMEGEMADADRAAGYQFGLTPPPVMKSGDTRYVFSGVEQFSIPAACANPEGAKLFLRFLYTDKAVEAYARLNGGAVMATTNALDLVEPYLTPDTFGMYGAYTEPGAAGMIQGFAAPPEGTRVIYSDEIFEPLSDVMSGRMTAAEWAKNIDDAYQAMADGH
ncbi:MAG: carbohydrate ABC transporter substrate-binding protein [Lachnospiraceae bacterium]|nr:carbohydrate ABC transporter substrate-binding protein [Lachnospiraceae bacterium]